MNVISIVLDTFRADIIGKGKKLSFVDTPNLDKLAAESMVFQEAFGEGQPTLQVRRALFTGCRSFPFVYNFDRRGHFHHAPGWHKIPPHQDTIAEILTERGYYTGLISDVYHMHKPTMNYTRGFTSYEFLRGQEVDNWKSGTPELIKDQLSRHCRNPEDLQSNTTLYQYLLNQRFRKGEEDYQAARVFRAASDWLQINSANKPFFLWIESFDPHEPWDPPSPYSDRYFPEYDGLDFIMPSALGPHPTADEIERTKALYYGEVTFVDNWIGHLLETVDALGLKDDTIIQVLSDHGTQVWDHGRFGKSSSNLRRYNSQIVWQMRFPDGIAKSVDAFVQTHDVAPTLLDALNVPCSRMEGDSVLPLAEGETEEHRQPIVIGWANFSDGPATAFASVRTKQWNYIVPVHEETGAAKLYNLMSDPGENENVLDAHPETVKELEKEVEALIGQPLPAQLTEICDPAPSPIMRYLRAKNRSGAK